jgi:hypothetical protein
MVNKTGGNIEVHVSNGCGMGMQSLAVTVHTFDAVIDPGTNGFMALPNGEAFQWLDCNNGFSEVMGATGQNFSSQVGGSFAVAVTQFGCVDTSACVPYIIDGIHTIKKSNAIGLFPNPAHDLITIRIEERVKQSYTIKSVLGECIYEGVISDGSAAIDTALLSRGVYFVTVPGLGYSTRLVLE